MNSKDISGKKFGRLTALSPTSERRQRAIVWDCVCECGKNVKVVGSKLNFGHTKSCGCLLIDSRYLRRGVPKSHGRTAFGNWSDVYAVWNGIKQRCLNKQNKAYKYYGGKGITICTRWLNFTNFLEDMGPRPKGTTVDRINNSLGYSKNNCRWATSKQQSRNKSSSRFIKYKGEIKTLIEWSEIHQISTDTINQRLNLGWSVHLALTKPLRKHVRKKVKGE